MATRVLITVLLTVLIRVLIGMLLRMLTRVLIRTLKDAAARHLLHSAPAVQPEDEHPLRLPQPVRAVCRLRFKQSVHIEINIVDGGSGGGGVAE